MKKISLCLSLGYAMLIVFTIAACQSTQTKIDNAQEKVKDAKQDISDLNKEVKADAVKVANTNEWNAFRETTELQIKTNEARIAEIRVALSMPGKLFSEINDKKVEKLVKKNQDMRIKLESYEKDQTDWDSFKKTYNDDLNELVADIATLTADIK